MEWHRLSRELLKVAYVIHLNELLKLLLLASVTSNRGLHYTTFRR